MRRETLLVRVAVPVPQLDLLTYRVPDDVPCPSIGARVVVPLGSRIVTGIVVGHDPPATTVGRDLKQIRQVLDDHAFVPPEVVELAQWTAEYYAAGPGETIIAALPPKTRGTRVEGHKTRRVAAITAHGLEALAGGIPEALAR